MWKTKVAESDCDISCPLHEDLLTVNQVEIKLNWKKLEELNKIYQNCIL